MLIMMVMLLIILAIVMKFYIPQLTTRPDLEVEHAIRGVLDAQAAAWNRGDLDVFMEGYWKSPDLKFFSGKDITSGWEATRSYQASSMGWLNPSAGRSRDPTHRSAATRSTGRAEVRRNPSSIPDCMLTSTALKVTASTAGRNRPGSRATIFSP